MKACGGAIQTSVNNITDDVLGKCDVFQEEQIGGDRYVCMNIYACVIGGEGGSQASLSVEQTNNPSLHKL